MPLRFRRDVQASTFFTSSAGMVQLLIIISSLNELAFMISIDFSTLCSSFSAPLESSTETLMLKTTLARNIDNDTPEVKYKKTPYFSVGYDLLSTNHLLFAYFGGKRSFGSLSALINYRI